MHKDLNELTLTGKEIKDLAEFAGLAIAPSDYTDVLETEIIVATCPTSGALGDGTHYKHVAYLSEYPEEGAYPLGDEIGKETEK
jgi:hypothetical protein